MEYIVVNAKQYIYGIVSIWKSIIFCYRLSNKIKVSFSEEIRCLLYHGSFQRIS